MDSNGVGVSCSNILYLPVQSAAAPQTGGVQAVAGGMPTPAGMSPLRMGQQPTPAGVKRPALMDTTSPRQRPRLTEEPDRQPSSQSEVCSSIKPAADSGAAQPSVDIAGPQYAAAHRDHLAAAAVDCSVATDAEEGPYGNKQKTTSKFRGVCWNKKNKKWQAAINTKGRYLYLGLYDDEREAARSYDIAALQTQGPHARLNFDASHYQDAAGDLIVNPRIDRLVAAHMHKISTEQLAQEQVKMLANLGADISNFGVLNASQSAPMHSNVNAAAAAVGISDVDLDAAVAALTAANALKQQQQQRQQLPQPRPLLFKQRDRSSMQQGQVLQQGPLDRNLLSNSRLVMRASSPAAAAGDSHMGMLDLMRMPSALSAISTDVDADVLLDQAAARVVQYAADLTTEENQVLQQLQVPLNRNLQQQRQQQQLMLNRTPKQLLPSNWQQQQQQRRQQQQQREYEEQQLLQDAFASGDCDQVLSQILASAAADAVVNAPFSDTISTPALAAAAAGNLRLDHKQQQQQQRRHKQSSHYHPELSNKLPQVSQGYRPTSPRSTASPPSAARRCKNTSKQAPTTAANPTPAAAAAAAAGGSSTAPRRPVIRLQWLLKHVPDGMFLDQIIPGVGSMCGIIYCCPNSSSSGSSGSGWGTSVWDGVGWHEVGLFKSEAEALQACNFVLDVGYSCYDEDEYEGVVAEGADEQVSGGGEASDQQQQQLVNQNAEAGAS